MHPPDPPSESNAGHISGPSGMLAHYSVQLWGRGLPMLDAIRSTLDAALSPRFEAMRFDGRRLSYQSTYATPDGGPPPQWTLERHPVDDLPQPEQEEAEQALMQSWWFSEAPEVVGTCTDRLVLTDHLHTGLDYQRRLHDLQRVLAGVISTVGGSAVWWTPTQQFLHPKGVLESYLEDRFRNPLPGGLNVRYYDVPQSLDEGDGGGSFKLMDTLGLGALGLTDLEISYRGLDPEAVSQVLFNTALYIHGNGPVLRDQETIQGPGPNDRWLLTRAESLAAPEREVWRVDPGAPFAVDHGPSEGAAVASSGSETLN